MTPFFWQYQLVSQLFCPPVCSWLKLISSYLGTALWCSHSEDFVTAAADTYSGQKMYLWLWWYPDFFHNTATHLPLHVRCKIFPCHAPRCSVVFLAPYRVQSSLPELLASLVPSSFFPITILCLNTAKLIWVWTKIEHKGWPAGVKLLFYDHRQSTKKSQPFERGHLKKKNVKMQTLHCQVWSKELSEQQTCILNFIMNMAAEIEGYSYDQQLHYMCLVLYC